MNVDTQHKAFINYIKACKLVLQYWKLKVCAPDEAQKIQDNALDELRDYLNSHGIKQLEPKWNYDVKDKLTWKFIDILLVDHRFIADIPNPEFKYKHLDN